MYVHEAQRHPSMNLGQAVAVCLYELVRQPAPAPALAASPEPERLAADRSAALAGNAAPSADLDRLSVLLGQMLAATGYTRRHPAHSGPDDLRRLVRGMALDRTAAQVWMGIVRQVLWRVRSQQLPTADSARGEDNTE
jgi:tRNA/rRNA methyltransferase